jgi:hypothetical protein
VVYGRRVGERELTLEPSGALLEASLVMRDRETDSWWSLMSSSAIGGELEGTRLPELPIGEKTTWGDWRRRHPESLVLSVEGREHVENNPYDNYFASEGTFRDLEVADTRLAPKEPIFAFQLGGHPYAAAHATIEGGWDGELGDARIFLHRPRGASFFESTRAYHLPPGAGSADPEALLARARDGELEPLAGFDTYWYTWVAVHPETDLLE